MSTAKKKLCTRVKKKNPQDNGDRLALIVFLPHFWVLPVPRLAQKKWAWLIPLAGHAPHTVTALKPFKSCSLLAYDGQTLEKMDCLRSVHLKKNQPHSADTT